MQVSATVPSSSYVDTDPRSVAAAALNDTALVMEKIIRSMAKVQQEQNTELKKIAGYYSALQGSSENTVGRSSQIKNAVTYLKDHGYDYSTLDTYYYNAENITGMLNDLSTLKDDATSVSQQTYADLQSANNRLQELRNLQANTEKLLVDTENSITRNYN